MHAGQARRLDQHLDVTRNPIPGVVGAGDGLRRDLEHFVDTCLVDADRPGEGGETCVRSIAGLVDDVDVEVVHLVVEQCLAFHLRLGGGTGRGYTHGGEGPEFGGIDALDC